MTRLVVRVDGWESCAQWETNRPLPLKREQTNLGRGGRLDALLCSCNARSEKTLVGHAQWEVI